MKIVIQNEEQLKADISYYGTMFPKSYTSYDDVMKSLEKGALGGVTEFGISAAGEWPDKCFTFELIMETRLVTEYNYLGITKC